MKQIIIIIAMLALLSSMASAATCSIDAKTEIKTGEELSFAYSISSTAGIEVIYVPQISCPGNMPSSVLKEKWAVADAKGKIKGEYTGGKVDAGVRAQECTARITINAPSYAVCEKKIRISAQPSPDLALYSCKDSACSKKQRTFVKGENVYLKADSKVSVSATAIITFPDKAAKTITLPGSFTATQSGEYKVSYTATKKGFKDFSSSTGIFVIEQAFTVPYAEFSAKAGQAVVRPVFRAPSALAASNTAAKTPAITANKAPAVAKTVSIKSFFSRITGYFIKLF
ncbi:MAG: hypothetical protein PHO02_07325 [Candidatus Nanoarchaeia archaeon]|nr:hypothetical protein [Candidatus Nanoarchaeia archaeon]